MEETFKVGDRVKWVHTSTGKRVSGWSIRKGTVEEIQGDIATIRYGKKTLCQVHIGELGKAAERKMAFIVESLQ